MVSEFAHLRSTVRTTLNGRLNLRGIHLTEVEVNDWTLHAHEVQHFGHRREASNEQVRRQRGDNVIDRPEEAIEMDEDDGEVNLLSQQLREVDTGRRRRRRLSKTLGQQERTSSRPRATNQGGGGILSTFLKYLYDAPVTAVTRRLSLTSDPADATADLAVTVTVTGEQTPESLSINGKLRPEDFAYLVNRAALSSSEALADSLRSGGWLQVNYFQYAHAVSLVPRDDGGVIQFIPGDDADLDLLQMPSSDGRASASVSLAGRTSTADYSSSGAIPTGLTSDASSSLEATNDEKATGIETSRGFLLDEDSPSYVPPSYLGEVDENYGAYTNTGSATTVNPPGNGGRVSVGLTVFIALACVSTVLLSSYFTRRAVKRRKNNRATKARQAYDLPRKICSREWVNTLRDRINARRSRINATNDAARTDAYVPPERRTQQQTMQPPINRATPVLPSRSPSRSTMPATSTSDMRATSGVMDTRAEYSSPAPVAARRGAQASKKTPTVSSSIGTRSNSPAAASRGSGKRVRFGADSVAGEELPAVLLSEEVDF